MRTMVTVEFTMSEANAVADAIRGWVDDNYFPSIDLESLHTANSKLAKAMGKGDYHGLVFIAA